MVVEEEEKENEEERLDTASGMNYLFFKFGPGLSGVNNSSYDLVTRTSPP